MVATIPAAADSFDQNQVPWSVRLYNYEASGGFSFLPAIDAATMEPLRFAFAANPSGDPGSVETALYSPAGFAEAYGRYSEVVGSGAFGFMVFVEPAPFQPVFAIPFPQSTVAPYFEAGQAPEWDPDNPQPVVEIYFDEEPLPDEDLLGEDPEEIPEEAILAAQAFPETSSLSYPSGNASDPVLLLESQLDLTTPEPSTFILVGAGLAVAGWIRGRLTSLTSPSDLSAGDRQSARPGG